MLRHIAFGLALGFAFITVSAVVSVPTAEAQKRARRAKRAKKAAPDAQTQAKAEEAQKEAEERTSPARFEWTARDSAVDMDGRADAKRDEAIEKLKRLMPTVADGPQKGELIFRLAEMYWGKSKYLHLRAMQQWDKMLDQWYEAGGKGPQPALDTVAENDESKLYRREALKLYRRILDEYPRYPRKDEVLYNLASSLYDMGEKVEGVKMYWTLIKQLPDSDFAPDAWLQLGEHFFNANKLSEAVKAYSKAVETKKPRIYSFALYKLAWCDFNLQEYDRSREKFQQVVAYAKKQQAGTSEGDIQERDRIQLLEEALSDMVRVYSHLDAMDDAFEYYTEEVGEEKAYRYLHRLAGLYNKEGKEALEIATYRELNTRYPYAPEAPSNQSAIMNAYAQLNKTDMVRKEARRLIDLYSPNSTWAQRNADNQRVLDKAFDVVESELSALVTEQHRAAQQTKLVDTYLLARDLYKEYLNMFTETENGYKFRFFYAEILYELKEFEQAAEQYSLVVEADREGEFVKPAAYTAVLAWEKVVSGVKEELGKRIVEGKRGKARGALKKLEQVHELAKGKKYEPTPLSAAEEKLAQACDTFVEVAPKDDETLKVKFKSARLYYIHNQFEEAAERFNDIIEKAPKDSLARIGAESILNSFTVREDWTQLNAWGRKFRDNKALMADKTFRTKVAEYVEGASFNEILHVFEPKKGPKDTAEHYVAFVDEFPKSKYAMVGLYNAVVNFDKANFLEKAIATAERVLGPYKSFKISDADLEKSKKDGQALTKPEDVRERVLFLAASFYERLAQFPKSATLYEQFAEEFPKSDKRADALFNAGLFREGLGQLDKAIANFERYIADYPKKSDVPDLAWRIGLILERKKDHAAVVKHFGDYARRYGSRDPARKLCAEFKSIEGLLAQGKEKEARTGYEGLLASYRKLKNDDKAAACPLNAVALASFKLLEPEFDTYMGIDLSGNEKDMAKKLMRKLEMVDSMQKRYTEVLAIGQGDYGIAALYRIGQMYQNLAQAMFETPCPRQLNDDQCMIYQAALQEKAFPLEEKAIEAYDNALTKAYELGLYNDWLQKTQEALKVYEPQRFPDIQEYDLMASETILAAPELVERN